MGESKSVQTATKHSEQTPPLTEGSSENRAFLPHSPLVSHGPYPLFSSPSLPLFIPKPSWLPQNRESLQRLPISDTSLAILVYWVNTNASLKTQLRDHLLQEAERGRHAFPCAVSLPCTSLPCCPSPHVTTVCFQVCFISL